MKAQSFERVLRDSVAPAPSLEARASARRVALMEFERAHSATPAETTRAALVKRTGFWRTRHVRFGGLAAACVLVVAVSVVWLMPTEYRRPFHPEAPVPTQISPEVTYEGSVQSSPEMQVPEESEEAGPPVKTDMEPNAGAALPAEQRGNSQTGAAQLPDLASTSSPASTMEEAVVTAQRRPAGGAVSPMPVTAVPANDEAKPDGRFAEVQVTGSRKRSFLSRLFARTDKAESDDEVASDLPRAINIPEKGRDKFEHFDLNTVKQVSEEPVSTFSADVDTASYSFVRKQLDQGVLPQKDSVRAEEMINYFDYAWPAAESREQPFRPTVVVSDSPWGKGRKLVHIGIKGYELPAGGRPNANLVLLLDVSGSMQEPDKLPLVKQSMKLLLNSLKPSDTVAIVVYAGAAGQVLAPTPVGDKQKIISALDQLEAGGSTAGAEGIELAYNLAESSFRKDGVNRILLCTDGDFNVGIDSTNELKGFVERKREKGVFLSVLGFGQGNYRDELAQALAQNGNGVAAYIDTLNEARKVLVQEAGSSLFTIAKDVKLQVEFNPATVAEYRLIGYETRALKREDFNNDAVDAGDVGAGHAVTAIYEITPVGGERMVDERHYAKKEGKAAGAATEYGFLKIRYKLPNESRSKLIEQPISIAAQPVPEAIARDVQFSTAVAGFAQLLRGGSFIGSLSYDDVIKQALASRGDDAYGYRNEFVQLVRKAQVAKGM